MPVVLVEDLKQELNAETDQAKRVGVDPAGG